MLEIMFFRGKFCGPTGTGFGFVGGNLIVAIVALRESVATEIRDAVVDGVADFSHEG